MENQLISGHYAIPDSRPFAGVPGPFGRDDGAQPKTTAEDVPACIADAASGGEATALNETSLIHDTADAPPRRSPWPSRRARVFAFAAGAVALVASLPCIEKRLEPARAPTAPALAPVLHLPQPVHVAPTPLVAPAPSTVPAGRPYVKATGLESSHAQHRATKSSRRVAHAVERSEELRTIGHPAAHEASVEQAAASLWPVPQPPAAAPLPPPSPSDSAAQPPQWAPRTQTRLIGG